MTAEELAAIKERVMLAKHCIPNLRDAPMLQDLYTLLREVARRGALVREAFEEGWQKYHETAICGVDTCVEYAWIDSTARRRVEGEKDGR